MKKQESNPTLYAIARIIAVTIGITLPNPRVLGQAEKPTSGATPQVNLKKVDIRITKVTGLVQVRSDGEDKWQRAKVGQILPAVGSELRTGPRSAVQFVLPPAQTVLLDRLGTITVIEALAQQDKVQTDLGLKYGRTQYQVVRAGLEHETTIHAPSVTLAVRGTTVSLFDQPPFKPEAVSFTGRVQFSAYRKQMLAFGGRRRAAVRADHASAAKSEAVSGVVDPLDSLARTETEAELVLALPGVVGFTDEFEFEKKESEIQMVSGSLALDLNWIGNADVDVFVISPLGEVVSLAPDPSKIVHPDGLELVSSGGMFLGDDGGAGGFGNEKVIWPNQFPAGQYSASAQIFSGFTPATFQIDIVHTLPKQSPETIGTFVGDVDSGNPLSTHKINVSGP